MELSGQKGRGECAVFLELPKNHGGRAGGLMGGAWGGNLRREEPWLERVWVAASFSGSNLSAGWLGQGRASPEDMGVSPIKACPV